MTKKYFLFQGLLIAAVLMAIVVVYPHLPARVATHWNASMQPNGHGAKWTLFLIGPGLMTAIALFGALLPWLSPKQFEVNAFRSTYLQVILIFQGMMAYVMAVILWGDTGHHMDVGRGIAGGICLTFALMGNLMGKVRRNFFIGIRTPWTLTSERVWYATHRFAAKTFVGGGIVGVALAIAGPHRGPGPILALLVASLAPVVYSLVLYKRLERRGEL
jgi:uncharacterized membrane protein